MTALVIREWDVPKDETRLRKYYETPVEEMQKKFKELNAKNREWSDGTGHLVYLVEYESLEDFVKAWNDKEYN